MYGHMNNVVHYSLFDTAVNGWLIENDLLDLQRGNTYGLVVENGCRYHAEIGFPSVITAGLRIAHLGTSSARFEIGLFEGDDDLAAAEGFFVHVNVKRGAHTPTALPDAHREVLARLLVT